jgi:peptidoglycan/LPS O-acetylase OafA/YrhL
MKYNYIKEIQSLRGISIILVFLFHLNQDYFSYGFLGVDIFFIISGFVITKTIYESLLKKELCLKRFYTSRFLRLFPALFFMIITVCFVIFLTFQIHPNPNILINTGLSSLIGLSNFYLIFIENDYFNSFDENIFEHMWSLSVEFQFYIFYPLFILSLFKIAKFKENFFTYFLVFILSIYILLNIFFNFEYFYHTGSRIGELLIGCLTFFFYKSGKNYFHFLIIALFFFIIYFFNQNIFYLIISVCFFTSSLVLTIPNKKITKTILNNRFLLVMGDASYSIYLWHLPVIYFSNIFFSGFDYYFFSIAISLILSSFSFFIIEKNFRRSTFIKEFLAKNLFSFKTMIFSSLSLIIVIFFVNYYNLKNEIIKSQSILYENISNKLNLINFPELNDYHDETCHENYNKIIIKSDCFQKNNSDKLLYFFGDSSMLDFYFTFKNLNTKSDKLFLSYNNSSFYKPIFTAYSKLEKTEPTISYFKDNINILSKNYKKVFLIMSFNHKFNYERMNRSKNYFEDQQKSYLNLITKLPKNVKLIFIKDTPYFKYSARKCAILQNVSFALFNKIKKNDNCDHKRIDIIKKMKNTNNMFDKLKIETDINFISLEEYFCNKDKCEFNQTNNYKSFAKKYDGYHFTTDASKDIKSLLTIKLNHLTKMIILN